MTFEPVLMVWDYYDGPRTGLAHLNGKPHYFKCLWSELDNNYSDKFELSPIDNSFLAIATSNWKHFRKWEVKFHSGLVTVETHPGNRGLNLDYDKRESELEEKIKTLTKIPDSYIPNFRPLPRKEKLPVGVMRDLEATWTKS